jgi:hypothetical protein
MKSSKNSKNVESPVVPEADFDDTIAHNRAVAVLDAASVPKPPAGYYPTDSDTRNRRLRKLATEHRAEAVNALREAAGKDLKADLGKYAPDPKRAEHLADRLSRSGKLLAAAQSLLSYAKEIDQIVLSDALLFLEAENKHLSYALEHEPPLFTSYPELRALFDARTVAILEGRARAAKEAAAPAPPVEA